MGHPSSPRLLVLHALRLKGIAETEVVVAQTGLDEAMVTAELAALAEADLIRERRGRISGHALTPEGKELGGRLLSEELDACGCRERVEAAYRDFLGFNNQLLGVCTAWQLRDIDGESHINDHSDPDYDRTVHRRLEELHGRVMPVLDVLAEVLDRFDGHRVRLQTALDRVLAGEHDWFTKPMFPSYHSVWFELHEDLLATLGTERSAEGLL
ncbi:MAG: hypothetical protein OSA99_20965 [Acidimicrobiales bacterium]|nr:hypothetical protein [Acidimicrobiales bacterium]